MGLPLLGALGAAGKAGTAGAMTGPVGLVAVATVCGIVAICSTIQAINSAQNSYSSNIEIYEPQQNSGNKQQVKKGSQQKQDLNKEAKRTSRRENSERKEDLESSECEITSISNHIIARLIRLIRLAGILQRISEETGFPRNEIIQVGPSRFQDRHSGQGRDIHAAHVVRVGEINPRLREYNLLYRELRNFIGHTQNVPRIINNGRVGRAIDRIQSAALEELALIDFSDSSLNMSDINILLHYVDDFLKCIKDYLNEIGSGPEDNFVKELKKALQKLEYLKMNPKLLYGKGRDGYLGKHAKSYQ